MTIESQPVDSCSNVFAAGLPALAYEQSDDPAEVHRLIAAARSQGPIAMGTHGPELLTYDLVRSVLRDPRFRVPQGMFLASQGITSGPLWNRVATNLISLDGEEHHRLRRLIARAFTPRGTARLRATVVDVMTELVDRHASQGHCEVVADIARKYPIPIICALLGTPSEDWESFSTWTDDIFRVFSWDVADQQERILTAWQELDDYVDAMVADRRHTLTDDLLSDLIRAEDDGDRLSADELRMLVAGLLMAGTDTTRNQLAASVFAMCGHPDQWSLLGRRPGAGRRCGRGGFPTLPGRDRHAADRDRGRRAGGGDDPGRHPGGGEPRIRQPRSRDLRISRASGHHSRGRAGDGHLRRGNALLPGVTLGASRNRRRACRDGAADARHSPRRTSAMEAADRAQWPRHVADRVRGSGLSNRYLGCRAHADRGLDPRSWAVMTPSQVHPERLLVVCT